MASTFGKRKLVVFVTLVALLVENSLTSSGDESCPDNCDCYPTSLICEHGRIGFPVFQRTNVVDFVFSTCLVDPRGRSLSEVPYSWASSLIVRDCAVWAIDDNAFVHLQSLKELTITGNRQLTNISAGAFNGLASLTSLDLSANALTVLPDRLFDGLPVLTELDLSGNKLVFTDGLFGGTLTVRSLECNQCGLQTVPASALSKLTRLSSLQLNLNNFTKLHSWEFGGLGNLRELSLDQSNIEAVSIGAFDGLHMLESLRISHNHIPSLREGVFTGLVRLKVLALNNNFLSSLSSSLIQWTSLERVYLAKNPWCCDCKTAWMQELNNTVVDWQNVKCSSPDGVEGQNLFTVDSAKFCNSMLHTARGARAFGATLIVALTVATCGTIGIILYRGYLRRRRGNHQLKYSVLNAADSAASKA